MVLNLIICINVATQTYIKGMPKWNEFIPQEIEYDYENNELDAHCVNIEEAIQCFYNKYEIRRNKKYKDRYKLLGTTDSGRSLSLIFQLKQKNTVRIITGWEI